MDNCKIGKAPNGKINKVLDISGNESTLFKEILNVPTLSLEEAIDAYKNIYGDKLKDKVKFQKQENDYNKERIDEFQKNESTRGEQTRDRTRWDSRRGNQTLTGAPTYKNATGATPELVALAEEYAEENGIDYVRQSMYVDIDEDRAYRIGNAYAEMKHEPENHIVKEAYQNLINQTLAQYKKLVEAGYQFYFFDDKNDPYDGKPARAMVELRSKKTMAVYATDSGFGSGATDINVEDNPMLQDTGFEWGYGSIDGKKIKVLANDVFRCFTPETLVRTSEGFKEIKDIKIGDLVLTHEGRFKKVYDTIKNPHKGKILNISTNASYNPIKVTPEHPFYVLKGNHGEQKNSICTPHICDRKQTNGNITAQEKYHSFDWVEAKDLKEKMWFPLTVDTTVKDLDFIEIPNKHYTGKTNIPQKIELTDDFLSFVGLYIAEGSGGTNRININLHKDEQYLIDLTDRFAKSIGYKMKSRIIGNGIALQINCKILKDWFSEWLGRGSFNKKIPNEFLQLPPEKLKHIAYGIFSGDGKKAQNCIEQTSLVLALQLVEVGSRLGMQPTTNRINYSKNVNHSDTYTTHEFSKSEHNFKQKKYTWKILNKDCRNITKIEEEYYEGFVYNIEVEDDHSYVVENVPVHNCVHDGFGHGLEGAGFRAKGEENAWQAHARLFTGSAIAAITSETRGQNSWLNYNKTLYKDVVGEKKAKEMYPEIWDIINVGEHNRTAKVEDTIFADQKVGLMPEWTWKEGFNEGVKLTYNEQGQHLAPNGKPSNLTVSQAIQVRTQEFTDWFGDWQNDLENSSKVVDENGEPLVVWHGTNVDFNEFKDGNGKDTGFHFGTYNAALEASKVKGGDTIKSYFLNIKNKIRLDESDANRFPTWNGWEIMTKIADYYETLEEGDVIKKQIAPIIEGIYDEDLEGTYTNIFGEEETTDYPFQLDQQEQRAWVNAVLKVIKIDGVIYENLIEDIGNDSYIVFNPNQIKSATENTGAFSNDSNNINYQIIGENPEKTPSQITQEFADKLKQNKLANEVFQLSSEELDAKLKEFGVSDDVRKQVDAWHGSPHSFKKFLLEKIGTGEGAQAFGWGLYFTDLESIARNYAKVLSNNKKGSVYLFDGIKPNKEIQTIIKYAERVGIDISKDNILQDLNGILKEYEAELVKTEDKALIKRYKTYITQTKKSIDFINSTQNITTEKNKNLYKVSLHKGKTPSEYTWLEWDKSITDKVIKTLSEKNKQISDVLDMWVNKGIIPASVNDKVLDGANLYRYLSGYFGGKKEASTFLLEVGIDGIKYPAESISRGATSDTARGFNYAVFDENAITIEEQIQFQKQLSKLGINLTVNGFTYKNDIYLNKDTADDSVLLHEYQHIFNSWLKENRPEIYAKGINLIEQELEKENSEIQDVIDFVKQNQPNLKGEAFKEEVLTEFIGRYSKQMMDDQKAKSPLMQWLSDFWAEIKNILGILDATPEQVANMSLREFAESSVSSLLSGENFVGNQGQKNFEKWKGKNTLVKTTEIQNVKTGQPIVARVYHGTTNEFYEFNSSIKGNIEGHLGKLNYFTSSYDDASENYLAEGADITGRIDKRQDELEDILRFYYQSSVKGLNFQQIIDDFNITDEEIENLYPSGKPKFIQAEEISRFLAEKELKGGTEQVLELFVKLNNPVVLGNGVTWFDALKIDEIYVEEATQEVAKEYEVTEQEAKDKYYYEIKYRAVDKQGYENKVIEALEKALNDNGYDENAGRILGDNIYEDTIDLNELEQGIRNANLYENSDNEMASSQVIADFFKNLGFDGIILADVYDRFKNMGIGKGDSHIHVFDEYNNQIKLADGKNITFGNTSDFRYQIIGEKGIKNTQDAINRLDNLKVAQEMEQVDKTPKEIRLATGWEKGADGLFRYEIADGTFNDIENIDYNTDVEGLGKVFVTTIGKVYKSEELFQAYPQLKDTRVIIFNSDNNSDLNNYSMFVANNFIYINTQLQDDKSKISLTNTTERGTTFIHELQHLCQEIEGFDTGGDANEYAKRVTQYFDKVRETNKRDADADIRFTEITSALQKEVETNPYIQGEKTVEAVAENKELSDLIAVFVGVGIYQKKAGEIEAKNAETRFNFSPQERLEKLLSETQEIPFEDQYVFRNDVNVQTSQKAIEPNLTIETPNGETFTNYQQALQATNGGKIKLKIDDVVLAEVDSDTDIRTFQGVVNHLVKQGGLSGKRVLDLNGDIIFITQGESETAKHLTSELVEQQAVKLLGVNNVKNNKDGDFILLDNLNTIFINGETFKREDIDNMSFEELSKKFGKPFALEMEFQRDYSRVLQPSTNRKQLDSNVEFKSDDELVRNIKSLLNKLGIKITSIEQYIKNNTTKNNNVSPQAEALMDVVNKIMAFKNGTITREDLIEETMHLIEATIDPKVTEGIRKNISKTAEWKQYSEEYFRIYSKEYSGDKLDEMVRREILGKVMANAVINNFAQSQEATLTEQSIFAKIKEILEDFFNTINNYFKPEYQKQIDSLNNDIYAKLMAGTLVNDMNTNQDFGTKFRLYSTSSNTMNDVVRLQKEAEKAISILRSTIDNIGEDDSSQGQALKGANQLLKNVNRAIKNDDDVEGKIEAIATFSKIVNIVQKQTLYLQRASKKAEKNKIPFSAEEMIVYNSLINEFQIGILPQIKTYLKKQDVLLPSEARLNDELNKTSSDIETLIGDIKNNVFKPADYVVDLMVKRLSLGKEEEDFLRDKANSQQIETNWFFQNFGTLSHSSNVYISALGSIVTKTDNDKRRGFQEDSKPFIEKLFNAGMLEGKKLSKLIDGKYLKSAIDFTSIEKVAQNKKYELFYKSLQNQINLSSDPAEKAVLQEVMNKKVVSPTEEDIKNLLLSDDLDVLDLTHSTTFGREFENWENEEYKLRHFTKDEQERRAQLLDIYDEYTKNFEKTYSADYSSIINKAEIDNGVPLVTADMKYEIEKLKKLRELSKNIYKLHGGIKDGIHIVDATNPLAKQIDNNLFVVLSPDAREDAILAVELNQIDFKKRNDLKRKQVTPMSNVFKSMLSKLSGTDAYNFLMLNSYVGYTNEYYDSIKKPSIIDKLEGAKDGENDLEIDDLIEEITIATSQINNILRANKTMNTPTEVSFDNMQKDEELAVKNYSLRLENYYANARAFLSKEEYKEVEQSLSETLPNRAFLKHLIDGGVLGGQVSALEIFDVPTFDDDLKIKADKVINTVTEHTTPSKQAEILNLRRDVLFFYSNGIAKFSSVQKRVFSLTEAEYNSMPNEERFAKMTSELLNYSYGKLLPYFKKSMPTGIDRVLYELEAGTLTPTEFLQRYDDGEYEFLSVTPNYNFQEVLDDPNKSKHFKNAKNNKTPLYRIFEDSATIDDVRNKSVEQLKKEGKLNKYANTDFLKEYGIDMVSLFENGIETATKNTKEFDGRQALIDLQKVSLEKQKMLGKHNLYLLPQKEESRTRKFDNFIHSGKGLKAIWDDIATFREDDAELGQVAGKTMTASHDGNYSIPKFGLRQLTNAKVTDDLLESYIWMNYKSNEHKARRINIGDAMTVGQALLGSEFEGNIDKKTSRIYSTYKEFYDFNFFGVKEAWTKQYNVMGVQFDGAKALKNFGSLIRFRNLAFTAISPITSALTGALNIKIETLVGQITDVDAMSKANEYFKDNMGDAAREIMGLQSKAKINILGEFWGWYEPLERYQNTKYGKLVRGLDKTMFGAHAMANFPVNPRVGISVLANTKFVDGGILEYRGFATQNKNMSQSEIRKEWSKLVSVLDVIDTKKDGTMTYDYAKISQALNNNFSEEEAKAFMEEKSIVIRGRIKDAIQKVDGQISEEDKSTSTRNAIFSFINTHRSWLMVATQNRFKKKQLNLSTGYMEEGSYTTVMNILFDDIIKESRKNGVSAMLKKLRTDYKNYDEVTKKNLKRVLIDAGVLTALMALTLLAMKKLDDDDEDSWLFQVGSLFLFRTTNEVASSSFALPKNIYDTMGGLVVGLNTLEMVTDLPSTFANEEIEGGRYAGLTAGQRYFYKHIPLMKDYNNLFRDVPGGINSYNYFNFTEGQTMQWLPSYFVLEEMIRE